MRWLGRGRCRCAALSVSAAAVHDDAGAFPGFNDAFARVRAVELNRQVVHVRHVFDQPCGVRFQFAQECAAVGDLAPRQVLPARGDFG